jgi:hypothetical protein
MRSEKKIMYDTFKILLAFVLFSTYASPLPKIPEWAETYKHKKYPQDIYILGVGISTDRIKAIELARADVAKQIQVKIESELETVESEIQKGKDVHFASEVKSKTKSTVEETIAGIEIAEIVKEKGQYYVLSVLNKQNYLSNLKNEMNQIFTQVDQLIESARKLIDEGKIFTAIDNYIDARNLMPELYTKNALYTALTGKNFPMFEKFTVSGITAEMRDVLSHIGIKEISGNNQLGKSGSPLPEPIKVKVFYLSQEGEVGIDKFPLITKYSNGEIISKKETNFNGLAEFNIIAIPTDGIGKSGTVIVNLNLTRAPEVFKEALTKSRVYFNYNIETPELKFLIHITNGGKVNLQATEKKLETWINELGYPISEDAQFIVEGKLSISDKKEINIPAGKQYYAESNLDLRLINVSSGKIISSATGYGKGLAIGSAEAAIAKSIENLKISKEEFAKFLHSAELVK